MSTEKQELYNLIDTLPEEVSHKIIDYILYIKYTLDRQHEKPSAPDKVIIKSEEDLINKLEEGRKSAENGEVYSVEEVMKKIESKYFQ